MPKASRKPSDPQDIAARRAERAANEAEITRLRSQGAVVSLDRTRRIVSAFRASPFHKLRETKTITPAQAAAAERVVKDWAVWKGLDGRPPPGELPGSRSATGHAPTILTDRMLKAGNRVAFALSKVGPLDRELLVSLVASAVEDDRALPWRDIVRRVTGVTQTVRQSQMVVAALENLARVYAGR